MALPKAKIDVVIDNFSFCTLYKYINPSRYLFEIGDFFGG